MNREILFRGKSILTGIFIEGNLVIDRNRETFIVWFNHKQKECWTSIYPYSVGQYTGLKDKNGNKIFEGDIVTIGNNLKAVVIWFNGSFRFQDELSSKATYFDDIGVIMRDYDVQVIGNIHDNPELLSN
ncbi:YopX family protein [Prevotella intermedia]|jgi:hypothetical protein|uniref:YopX family protein n=1 Tax=Prevotella intermedia TaxID=28131 RepID=UPI000C24EFD3|nr:YopX family protein [Prevotella intermedia]PJI21439.1 hypothetical protein CTM45_11540 [Prevotella intermedia]